MDELPALGPLDTPRRRRVALNRIEMWWKAHNARFAPEERTLMRAALEYAGDARHIKWIYETTANLVHAGDRYQPEPSWKRQ